MTAVEDRSDAPSPIKGEDGNNTNTSAAAAQNDSSKVADDVVLLNMMQADIDRAKAAERVAQEDSELKQRDEMRSNIMLRLAQEQIEKLKEDNGRLRVRLDRADREAVDNQKTISNKDSELSQLREDLKYQASTAATKETESKSKIDRSTAELENNAASLKRLREDLAAKEEILSQLQKDSENKSRLSFEEKVTLEAKLKSKEEELTFLQDLRDKETKTATSREYDLSLKIKNLSKEIKDNKDDHEVYKKSTYEATTSMNTENEQLKLKLAQLEGMTKATDRDNFEKIQRLTHELSMLRDRSEQDQLSAKAREKVLDEQIAKLCTDLRVAQAEINTLAEKDAGNTKSHVDTIVQLSASRDALRNRVTSLEGDNERLTQDLREKELEFGKYRDEMNKKYSLACKKHEGQLANRSDEISKVTYELTTTTSTLLSVQEELAETKRKSELENKTHQAEVGALKAEIDGYKKSVSDLEKHIKENYAFKALEEQNNSLKAQNGHLKAQVASTNQALANLRVEADISEGYRIKLMQEEVDMQLGRVNALEKERRFARPLIQDLVEMVQKEDLADPAMARDIDMYFRQFGGNKLQ